jgi:hypothetical protein
MKKTVSSLAILGAASLLATAAFAVVPEPVTMCGMSVNKWVCSVATPAGKPTGWYTPSSAIPSGKTIYKSCSTPCAGYHPVTGECIPAAPVFVTRSNHVNDVVLPSGSRRAYCGTDASHASAYYTLP